MSIPAMPPKTADELLDYKIDMTAELAGRLNGGLDDTISTAVCTTLPADLSVFDSDHDGNTVTIWLTDGLLGSTYEVAAVMHTTGGRIYHRSFKLSIKDR